MQTAATVRYTNVQLEPGPVATPFEHRPIGTELALCQRYYYPVQVADIQTFASGPGVYLNANLVTNFPVTMRIAPTITATDDCNIIPTGSSVTPTGNGGGGRGGLLSLANVVSNPNGIARLYFSTTLGGGDTLQRGVSYTNHQVPCLNADAEL